jgi:isopentenyl-diphosphate delta-isomerase
MPSRSPLPSKMALFITVFLGSLVHEARSFTHSLPSRTVGPPARYSDEDVVAPCQLLFRLPPSLLCSSSCDDESSSSAAAYGIGMNQDEMMERDMLVIVDENDNLVGGVQDDGGGSADADAAAALPVLPLVTKRDAHSFSAGRPRGVLHRAFSLFCFNDRDELLLTRRSSDKITFPGVWTNTACSHPLLPPSLDPASDPASAGGVLPDDSEVDVWPDAYPAVPGIKRAALRKAKQELGLDLAPHLPDMQFVSRFHYWASDVPTHGKDAPWGEHEIDYILMVRLPGSEFSLQPNPEEVAEIRYVGIDQLQTMFQDPQYTWSPWFVGIMHRGGFDWWRDLDNTLRGLNTNTHIEFFDPSPDHVADYNLDTHTKRTGVMMKMRESLTAAERLMRTEPKNWVRIT